MYSHVHYWFKETLAKSMTHNSVVENLNLSTINVVARKHFYGIFWRFCSKFEEIVPLYLQS